jgi:hypothetical protein
VLMMEPDDDHAGVVTPVGSVSFVGSFLLLLRS